MKGRRSHTIVEQGLTILKNLQHRGACGCEENTGDGAGILVQIPHAFFARECERLGVKLPVAGEYGTGLVFLPRDAGQRAACEKLLKPSCARKARLCSAGATCRWTMPRSVPARAPVNRCSGRFSLAAAAV